jgi:ribokinase
VQVDHLPRPGETLTGSSFATLPGGKGANQAVAVARLGGGAVLLGCVGNDAFGHALLQNLKNERVSTRLVRQLPGTTSGVATIAVEASGQNAITVVPGANARLRPADLRRAESLIARADAVLVQLEIPLDTARTALEIAARHGVLTVLDPAPVPPGGLPPDWKDLGLDILSPNETEAGQLSQLPCVSRRDAVRALDVLLKRYRPALVVLKRGSHGALIHSGTHRPASVPAFPVQAIDTTAAGDAFTGALALRLAENASLDEAVRFANAAGALATTRLGAQNSMPTRSAVHRLLRQHPAPPPK